MTTRAPFLTETLRRLPAPGHSSRGCGDYPGGDPGLLVASGCDATGLLSPTSQDLGDLPKRIRILGENLVIYKDKRGTIGLLELHCSHRGASLGVWDH